MTDIDFKATVCPHCKSKIGSGSCGTFVILFFITMWIAVFANYNSTPWSNSLWAPDMVEVCTYSQMKIEKWLKSPSSAEHASCSQAEYIKTLNKHKFSSYVDSQNSFGAMIRTNYICITTFEWDWYNIQCDIK